MTPEQQYFADLVDTSLVFLVLYALFAACVAPFAVHTARSEGGELSAGIKGFLLLFVAFVWLISFIFTFGTVWSILTIEDLSDWHSLLSTGADSLAVIASAWFLTRIHSRDNELIKKYEIYAVIILIAWTTEIVLGIDLKGTHRNKLLTLLQLAPFLLPVVVGRAYLAKSKRVLLTFTSKSIAQ